MHKGQAGLKQTAGVPHEYSMTKNSEVINMADSEKALRIHEQWNGKLETTAKAHVNSREDLSIAYTPGVAEPCKVIAKDPEAAYKYTMKANTVAVVSD